LDSEKLPPASVPGLLENSKNCGSSYTQRARNLSGVLSIEEPQHLVSPLFTSSRRTVGDVNHLSTKFAAKIGHDFGLHIWRENRHLRVIAKELEQAVDNVGIWRQSNLGALGG
jgi:hypothetical protein